MRVCARIYRGIYKSLVIQCYKVIQPFVYKALEQQAGDTLGDTGDTAGDTESITMA